MKQTKEVAAKESPYTPSPHVKLVLNGGQQILDSATIPVEWHFSNELIEKKPRYIVICDQEGPLSEHLSGFGSNSGHRHVFAIEDLVGYIQLHCSGRHHFVIHVICGDAGGAKTRAKNLMKEEVHGRYELSINSSNLLKGWRDEDKDEAITALEFEVPKELFAEKPETPFGRFVWLWVNRWFRYAPVDQCEYRKRKWTAFTIQPPLFLLGHLLLGVFGTLYTLIGAFILLFIGYRPISVLMNVVDAWAYPGRFTLNLSEHGRDRWRVWSYEYGVPPKCIPLWAIPTVVLSWGVIGTFGVYLLSSFLPLISAVVALVAFVSAVALIARYLKLRARDEMRMQQRREAAARAAELEEERRKAREEAGIRLLKAYATLDNVPDKVDIQRVLKRVDRVTRFRLSFWGLKAKVCKPFAK
jgi:hypothetical protein